MNRRANVKGPTRARKGRKPPRAAEPGRARPAAKSRRSPPPNRRVRGKTDRPEKAPPDPAERKARNRTILLLGVLALVNAYVFLWRGEGGLSGLSGAPEAAIGRSGGVLAPVADPLPDACTGDPVRIFAGLQDLIELETSLSSGATLRLALLDRGVASEEIDLIEASIRSKVDLSLLGGSGAPVRLAVDRLGGVRALEIELAEGHLLQACRQLDGFAVRNIQHPLRVDVEVIALELGTDADVAAAVAKAEEQPELAAMVADTLAYDVDLQTEARPGDKISAIVEKRWLGRSFHRYGPILAIRYVGAAGRVSYYRYKPPGRAGGFFNHKGEPMRRELRRTPVAYVRVPTEARGMLVPALEVVEGRVGAVYRVPEGTPVVAVADGIVRDQGRDGDRGVFVDLELSDGRIVRYAHLLRIVGELEPGTKLRAGWILGLAGHTGKTPHDRVRIEIVDAEGEALDPMVMTAKGAARPRRTGDPVPEVALERYEEDIQSRGRALKVALR